MAAPTIKTLKRLFALGGNQCAFPGCTQTVIDGATIIGHVCHIKADKAGGPRYDPSQTETERQEFENLLVLCSTHHVLVDGDEAKYTVELLRSMKRRHETYAPTRPKLEIDDAIARKIQRAMIVGATMGAAAGAAVAGYSAAQGVAPVLDWLLAMFFRQTHDPRSERRRARRQLLEILRFGPTGHIATGAADELHRRFGLDLGELFGEAGWLFHPDEVRLDNSALGSPCLVLFVMFKDESQIPNAKRTVDQLLDHLGFQPADQGTYETNSGRRLRIRTIYGRRR
jgi:hypothetical protein